MIKILLIGLLSFTAVANNSLLNKSLSKDKLVGNILKNALESYHYRRMKIDDDVSDKAFNEFLKRTDFAKQFLYQADVNQLKKYHLKFDDSMVSGDYAIASETQRIMQHRINEANSVVQKIFKKKFNFKKHEKIMIDPKDMKFVNSTSEFKERWRKLIKSAVLSRYLANIENQKEDFKKGGKKKKISKAKRKEKKKGKKKKKLSNKQLRAKAVKNVKKKYANYFKRLLKEKHSDFMENYFNSVTAIYDPHTVYMPPKRKEDFDIDISGSLEGIGAVLSEDGQYIKVVSIVPGGAAWRGKQLKVDDKIIAVSQGDSSESVDLIDMRVDDAVRYIRGKKGTVVKLNVKRADNSTKLISIVRDVVEIEASFAKSSVLFHKKLKKKIGYINLPKFYRAFDDDTKNCSEDVKIEIERLIKDNVEGIIFDLRSNGGGALEDARRISGFFVKKGPIVQVKKHSGEIDILEDRDNKILFDKPLIILTNRFSASASEIFAAAMQDYGRAIILGGADTHGKGTVQAIISLNQGPLRSLFSDGLGALKVTIQKFYRINGGSTQFKGVVPDVIVPDPYSYTKSREKELDYALPWDKVPVLKYKKWTKHSLHLDKIKKLSKARLQKNKGLMNIQKSVNYLVKKSKRK